jgi:uncharacterized protein
MKKKNNFWFLTPLKTKNKYYLYDTIFNKIYEISLDIYNLLKNNTNGEKIINKHLQEHVNKINLTNNNEISFKVFPINYIIEMLEMNISNITLCMTEQCNMRCNYCVYSGKYADYRTHSTASIELKTAYACVDLIKYTTNDKVFISFYGGEPLIEIEKIKKIVIYAEKEINKDIVFSISTNGKLLNSQNLNYLKDKGFFIHISFDGPKSIQDKYRLDIEGNGIFYHLMEVVKYLKSTYPAYYQTNISFNTTIVDWDNINLIKDFFQNKLFENQRFQVNSLNNSENSLHLTTKSKEKLKISLEELETNSFFYSYFNKMLSRIDMILKNELEKERNPNGICIPGIRKLVCQVNGNLTFCEKTPDNIIIGNVNQGINYQIIKELIDEYTSYCDSICKECWCVNFCDLCFAHAFDKKGFNLKQKEENCIRQQNMILEALRIYCLIKENERGAIFNLN